MRIERVHGRLLLCGVILPMSWIQTGQVWAAADGSNRSVTVKSVDSGWVKYQWFEGTNLKEHQKTSDAFQSRYCFVFDEPEDTTRKDR